MAGAREFFGMSEDERRAHHFFETKKDYPLNSSGDLDGKLIIDEALGAISDIVSFSPFDDNVHFVLNKPINKF